MAGYKAGDVLVDPCCGSGTFLIEAAMIATNTPPNLKRTEFGFLRHPDFNRQEWHQVKDELESKIIPLEKGKIFGIEESIKTFQILKRSIHRSQFDRWIAVVNGDFRAVSLPLEPTFVITNPPYGVRLKEIEELEGLYQDLGDFMKQKTKKPARGAIFTGNLELAKCVGLKTSKRHVLNNGGIECRLFEYDLY
jgi:putative N6-adenine-specific DNA methylase